MLVIDQLIINIISNIICVPLTIFFTFITHLGDYLNIWIFIGFISLFFIACRKMGILLISSTLVLSLLNNSIIKVIFSRERPCVLNDSLIVCPSSFSMPSGHSLTSFAAATIIYYYNKRLGIGAYLLACLIAISRVYLGVHYPSDVIIGGLLGVTLVIIFFKKVGR
ncbi:MAG: phosphatase PAP2 family protein [Erysipelotrichaceae bacterium]